MKLKSLFMMVLLTIAGQTFADDNLSVADVPMNAGETKQFKINLFLSSETYSAMQFDLVLPKGISIPIKNNKLQIYLENSHRTYDEDEEQYSHSIASNQTASDENSTTYTVAIYDANQTPLIEGDGSIVRVNITADESLNGDLTAYVKNIMLAASGGSGGITEGTALANASFTISVAGVSNPTATVEMNPIGDAYWSTYYNSTNNMEAPEGTQVFTASLNKAELTLTEVSDHIIKAGNGVILKSTASPITLTITESSATESYYANNCLVGTMTTITNPGNAYVLNYKENIGVAFYKLRAQGTIGANKAYLIYSSTNARESFSFSNISNGIESITSDMKSSHQVFDLQGRRVIQPKSGVYIMDGKKVVIK